MLTSPPPGGQSDRPCRMDRFQRGPRWTAGRPYAARPIRFPPIAGTTTPPAGNHPIGHNGSPEKAPLARGRAWCGPNPPGRRKGAARRRGTDNRGGSQYPIDHFQCSPVGCDGKDLDRCSRPQQGRVGPRTTAVSPVEPTRTAPDNRGGPRPCRGPGRHDFAHPSPRGPAGRNHRIVRGRREHRSSNRPLRDQGAPPPTTTEGDRIQPGPLQTVTFPLPRPILAQWHGFALDLNPGWKRTERRTCTVPYRSISS